MKEIAETFDGYVPLLQSFLWFVLILIAILVFKKPISNLLCTIESRIKQGSSIKLGDIELGKSEFNISTEDAQISNKDLKLYGNPDNLKLLFKASTNTWSNSTKALETHNGCLIQVTNEQKQANGSWIAAEALTFIPDVVIKDMPNGNGRYLAPRTKEIKDDIS